jgi:NADH:ubiquinone oxidoreductase subunit E
MGETALFVCLGSSCRDAGSDFLLEELKRAGGQRLETTFCQGRCAVGPNVRLSDGEGKVLDLHGQGPDQAKALVERAKKSIQPAEKPFN